MEIKVRDLFNVEKISIPDGEYHDPETGINYRSEETFYDYKLNEYRNMKSTTVIGMLNRCSDTTIFRKEISSKDELFKKLLVKKPYFTLNTEALAKVEFIPGKIYVFKEREDKYPNDKYLYINGGKFIDLGYPCYYSDENYFEWTNINSIILTTEEVLNNICSHNSDKFMKRNDREYILTDEHDCHLRACPLECYRNYEYHLTDEIIPAAAFYKSNVGVKIFGKSKTDNGKFFCQFYIRKNDEWNELKDHGFMSCLEWYDIERIIGDNKFEELFTRSGSIYDCEVKTTTWGSRDYHPFSSASMFLVDGKTYVMFGLEDGLHIIDPETGIEEISTYDWFDGKEVSKFYAR